MPSFALERVIAAPPADVFDLSLDVDVHLTSQRGHDERVADGPRSGLLNDGDEITWSARHFGIRFSMTSLVFDVERPHRFCDRQVRGPFARFAHVHEFEPHPQGTLMRDEISFRSPLGPLGAVVDALVMKRHLRRVITERNDAISAHFGASAL